jgi:hypothetical protein
MTMPQFIKVENWRCGEYDDTEMYVNVGPPLDQDIVDKLVDDARNEYLALYEKYAGVVLPPRPPMHVDAVADDSLTIGELKAQIAAYNAAVKSQAEARDAYAGSFHAELARNDILRLDEWIKKQNPLTSVVSWGHRHGQKLQY